MWVWKVNNEWIKNGKFKRDEDRWNACITMIRQCEKTMHSLGDTIIHRLFHKRYANHIIRQLRWYYNTTQSCIDKYNTHSRWYGYKMVWCNMTICSPKTTLHKFGVRGMAYRQHNKQAIVLSLIVKDNDCKIRNKKFLGDT